MFKGGVKEAAKMLAGLEPSAQKKLLDQIRKKDPTMAMKLEENLISMEDLQYATAPVLVSILRDINLETFGLALRTMDEGIVNKLIGMVSTGMKLDIEDGLKGKPRKVSEVQEAQSKVLEVIRKKIDQGHISLSPDKDEYV